MTTIIDLTDIDIAPKIPRWRASAGRINITSGGSALDLTGVAAFTGEILPNRTAAIGSGTAISWPVIDATGGGVSAAFTAGEAAALTGDSYWVYVSATVAGSIVALSGPLQVTAF